MVRAVRWADVLVFDNGVITLSLLVLLYLTSCYSFAITYFECPRVGNFRLKNSTIRTIRAKFKQYNFCPCQHF